MANYRYLGYGITNNEGVATLDHDSNGNPITHSYTGTGAGEIDIVASTDDSSHISDSSLQSEIYEVWDCIVADVNNMLPTSKYTWNNPNASPSVEIEDDHKKLSAICTGQTTCRFILNEYLADNFEITCKIESNGNDGRLFGLVDANNISKYVSYNSNFPYTRILRQGDVITFKRSADGISWENVTSTESSTYDSSSNQKLYLGFGWGANGECWFKLYDVKAYYI